MCVDFAATGATAYRICFPKICRQTLISSARERRSPEELFLWKFSPPPPVPTRTRGLSVRPATGLYHYLLIPDVAGQLLRKSTCHVPVTSFQLAWESA